MKITRRDFSNFFQISAVISVKVDVAHVSRSRDVFFFKIFIQVAVMFFAFKLIELPLSGAARLHWV